MPAEPNAPRRRLLQVHRRLLKAYGEPAPPQRRDDGLSELINCILSQHTNDRNTERAYAALRKRFPRWSRVRDAPTREVVDAIRGAGLANQKGPRIQAVLREITRRRGRLSINFLKRVPLDEAKAWLRSLHGVGPKTVAVTLLFGLGCPAFPVDTHVYRVSTRLGFLAPRTTFEKAHAQLEALVPAKLYYPLHINLIRHGRAICIAARPRCERCLLTDLCAYYAQTRQPAAGLERIE